MDPRTEGEPILLLHCEQDERDTLRNGGHSSSIYLVQIFVSCFIHVQQWDFARFIVDTPFALDDLRRTFLAEVFHSKVVGTADTDDEALISSGDLTSFPPWH